MKTKNKSKVKRILARASAGAAIGFAAYMLLKSDKPNLTAEKQTKEGLKKEELFI